MKIIGCDFHPSFQQIAMCDLETGEVQERKLSHSDGQAERFLDGLPDRGDGPQIGEDRIAIWTSDLGVGTERHRRIKQAAVGKASSMQHRVELVRGPCSDPGLAIGRDIGCVERPEWSWHRQAAGEEFAFGGSVAGDAVAGPGEIFALRD